MHMSMSDQNSRYTPDASFGLLHSMLRIRRVEEALATHYAAQTMRCPMHLCIGQEAIAAGVSAALTLRDRVYSNHRAHGHYLAKGGNLNSMIAEIYGKRTGCCGGRGGSMHLIDLNVGFMGATPIVGGTLPLAVGSAWASSLRADGCVTAVFFGDGCFEEGVMHESLNFAALHRLPVLFVCENNNFSVYTKLAERQPNRPIYGVVAAHGITAVNGDGNDVEKVLDIATAATERIRNGDGPQFLEFATYRWREHCGPNFDDDLNYRSAEEVKSGLANCPIDRFTAIMASRYSDTAKTVARHEAEIAAEIETAFEFALSSPAPTRAEAEEKVYA